MVLKIWHQNLKSSYYLNSQEGFTARSWVIDLLLGHLLLELLLLADSNKHCCWIMQDNSTDYLKREEIETVINWEMSIIIQPIFAEQFLLIDLSPVLTKSLFTAIARKTKATEVYIIKLETLSSYL